MISKFAMDEIDAMKEAGLEPTPRDIVRLNALALKVHQARGKFVRNTSFLLPRVAVLRGGKTFREPSIGHEIWIDAMMRFIDSTDFKSELAINCFALSRPASDLPKLNDLSEVDAMIKSFCLEYQEYTVRQLEAAVRYAKFGADWIDDEEAPERPSDEDSPTEEDPDSDFASANDSSIAVGVLHNAVSVLSGLTLAEIKELPRHEVEEAIRKACWLHGKPIGTDEERVALGNFYATLNEIKSRLNKDKHGTAS